MSQGINRTYLIHLPKLDKTHLLTIDKVHFRKQIIKNKQFALTKIDKEVKE